MKKNVDLRDCTDSVAVIFKSSLLPTSSHRCVDVLIVLAILILNVA